MKKLTAGALAALLSLSTSVTALAGNGTITSVDGQQTIDVTGEYKASTPADIVYKVDVTWDAMKFVYTEGSEGTWDADRHEYTGVTSPTWSSGQNEIKITNHSNTAVDAKFAYVNETGVTGVTGGFYTASTGGALLTESKVSLESAEPVSGSTQGEAKEAAAYLQLGGELASGTNGKIGTVTVTIE